MSRVYNFSAGPSMLPEPVLDAAVGGLRDYRGSGMSVMELSHRSREFRQIISDAEQALRRLMSIPDDYSVLFLQGGASTQFAMVPMNLSRPGAAPAYVHTGNWSKRAIAEARLLGEVSVVASSQDRNFSYVPRGYPVPADASYLHVTSNNTLEGTRFAEFPDSGQVPLVADMSSEILSRPVDVTRFGLIYAGAQKNIGPAGLTIVIVRTDLVGEPAGPVPTMLRYDVHCEAKSLYNTPSCYAIYVAGLVFEWLEQLGGVPAIAALNEAKAAILYDFLDQSRLFSNSVAPADRSVMNVPFTTPSDELNEKFLAAAESAGLRTLRGHRLVGGMRASIYNAMPADGVRKLTEVMQQFEDENPGSLYVPHLPAE
jgi:phosphoserine aminotransferase